MPDETSPDSDDRAPAPDEVLASATDRLEEAELTLEGNEEILNAVSELTPVFENERSYFALGNYDREPIRRLNLVVDRLNRRPDAYAFRMVDVKGEWDNSNLAAHRVHRSVSSRSPFGRPRHSRSSA